MPEAEAEHHILDPRTGFPTEIGKLLIEDPGVQGLGKYPDIAQIHPGDILLFAPLVPNASCKVITTAQRNRGFGPADSVWTHAAIYLRAGLFVEANIPRVQTCSIWTKVPAHLIRVRRATGRRDPATFGYRLALEMTTRIGEPYHTGTILRILAYSVSRLGRGAHIDPRGRVFCSQVIADSFLALKEGAIYHEGADLDLFNQISPAHLSHSTVLQDVSVRWLALG
jgi:hypothetical protein